METPKLTIVPIRLKPEEKRILAKLRDEFRRWYGRLSVNELVSNKRLVEEIEAIERLLNPLPGGTV
jgi:hypothetical protein